MFNLIHFIRRPKFEQAKESGFDIETVEREVMHNVCELNEKSDVTWNAGLNL
jgi:hypothetical protein